MSSFRPDGSGQQHGTYSLNAWKKHCGCVAQYQIDIWGLEVEKRLGSAFEFSCLSPWFLNYCASLTHRTTRIQRLINQRSELGASRS